LPVAGSTVAWSNPGRSTPADLFGNPTPPLRPHQLAPRLIIEGSIDDGDFLGSLGAVPRTEEKKRLVAVDADMLGGFRRKPVPTEEEGIRGWVRGGSPVS